MKYCVLICMLLSIVLSCSEPNGNTSSPRSIVGTFVLQSSGEFSSAEDTLVIKPVDNQRDLYLIERRVSYQRKTESGKGPREKRQEKAAGIWDSEHSRLIEQKYGKTYFFSGNGSQLFSGSNAYTRIRYQIN